MPLGENRTFHNFPSWLFGTKLLIKINLRDRNFPLHLLLWKEKPKNYLNEGLFPLHETTKLAIHVFLTKKTTNNQRKNQKNTKLGAHWLNEQKDLKPPTFLLGKNQHTLKLSTLVLANKEIENTQPFLLAKDPRTSNNQNIS